MMDLSSTHGVAFAWHLHVVFGAILAIGFVLLLMWAYKNLSKDKLKNLSLWFILVGGVGVLLTGMWGMRGWQMMHGDSSYCPWDDDDERGEEVMEEMFEEMEEHMDL
jgi:hypothetical protein